MTAGGDVAPDILDATRPWPRVLMLTGKTDPWYTPERLEAEAAQLRGLGADVRTQAFDGGHEWGDAVSAAVAELLGQVEAGLA